jgi:hypothetical protein
VTGHKSLAEVERTAAADQERLAREAVRKQADNDAVANSNSSLPNRAKR